MRRKRTSELDRARASSYWREDDARAVLASQEASGMSVAVYARHHGLSPARLLRWSRRLRQTPSALTFHPVEIVSPPARRDGGALELVVRGDRRIVVSADFDPVLLRRLVETLESWSC